MFAVYADDKLLYSPRLLNEGYVISEPQATLELSKAGSFSFNLPITNPLYSSLKKLKTIITIRDDGEVIWKGRVLNDTKDFYNTKAVTCEGELAFLNDIQYEPHDFSKRGIKMGEYFKKLIEHYAAECSPERMIRLGRVSGAFTDVLIYPKTTDYTNVWNLISGNLIGASTGKVGKDEVDLSDYDRYLYIHRQNGESFIDFVEDIGKGSGQVIEFGRNLLDLSEYVNAANVYTQIIPLGKADSKGNRVDIKLVNGGKNYLQSDSAIALFGKIQKSVIWDDVTNRNTLKANGQRMLDKAVEMAIKITIRAFDLHQIHVDTDKIEFGDKVHVVSLPHEISSDFLCSKITFALDNPENTEYTFGMDFESMTGNYASYKRTYQYKMSAAFDDASSAQASADDKRRIFTEQPIPPYDVGDLWVGDSTSEILRCQIARTEEESYSADDWIRASKYTDNTGLNHLKDNLIAEINDSREEVTIDAKKINLKGAVTAEDIAADAISAKHIQADSITIANMAFGSTAEKIWENAAPNVAFPAQEIEFDHAYSCLFIVYKGATDPDKTTHTNRSFVQATQTIPCDMRQTEVSDSRIHIMSIPLPISCYDYIVSTGEQYYKATSGAPLMAIRISKAIYWRDHPQYGTGTYILFYEGAYADSYNSITTTGTGTRNGRTRNEYAVPIQIYGIK